MASGVLYSDTSALYPFSCYLNESTPLISTGYLDYNAPSFAITAFPLITSRLMGASDASGEEWLFEFRAGNVKTEMFSHCESLEFMWIHAMKLCVLTVWTSEIG